MPANRSTPSVLVSALITLAVFSALTWMNAQFTRQNPGGNDFLPRWIGARFYLTRGWSPYSDQTTQAIQEGIYGRPARPDEDQSLFVYPLYSLLVFAPYALVGDYDTARALWMTTLEFSLVLIVALSLQATGWRLRGLSLAGFLLFAALWYHGIRPVVNGNPTVLCAVFITAALRFIREGREAAGGACLALAGIKPQIVALLIPYALIWSASTRRWRLFWGIIAGLAVFVVGAMMLIPDWLAQNLRQVTAYPGYTVPGTPRAIFELWWPGIGDAMGWTLTFGLAAVLAMEWWRSRLGDFYAFAWAASLTLALTQWIGIQTDPTNYIVLFFPMVLTFAAWEGRWKRAGRVAAFVSVAVLFFGLWALFLATVEYGAQPQQHPIMFFPLPLFVLLGLYLGRTWAMNPSRDTTQAA
jgi:hypothetical protein